MPNKHILILVIFTSVMGQISTDIYLPSLPSLITEFNSESGIIKSSISIFFLGYAVSQILCGPLSDQYGRKYFMLSGVIIFSVGCYLALASKNIETLLMARIIQGVGTGCFGVSNRAILFDSYKGNDYTKSISIVGIVMAISPMVAPALGGLLHDHFGWKSIFIFMISYSFILFVSLFSFLPETITKSNKQNKFSLYKLVNSYKQILVSKDFWSFGLINMLGFCAFIFYLGTASFLIIDHLGYSSSEYGKLICLIAFGYISGGIISNKLVNTKSRMQIINIGNSAQVCSILVYLLLYITESNPIILALLPMTIFVMGTGMINPNATAILVSNFEKNAASSAAAMGFLMTSGSAIISSLIFMLYTSSIILLGSGLLFFAFSIRFILILQNKMASEGSVVVT